MMGLDVPKLLIGDQTIHIAKQLQWYELLWCGIPMLLALGGGAGAVGAIAGIAAFSVNTKLFRGERSTIAKYALTALFSALATFIYLFIALLLSM